jgi:tRNA (guanine-N7-)-methyltransferase
MERYQQIVKEDGIIHLKTDSPFLYTYTKLMLEKNNYNVKDSTDDLYHSGWDNEILSIKTHYEKQWLERGLSIKYIQFILSKRVEFVEVDEEIEKDNYKSYNRRGSNIN